MKLPSNVYAKHGAYYHVHAEGKKRVWKKLCAISEGFPALYLALSNIHKTKSTKSMSDLVDLWMVEVMPKHSPKTQKDDVRLCQNIKNAFVEFSINEVEAPDIFEFLNQFSDRPRTYNQQRSIFQQIMRLSIEKGFRSENPVKHIKTMSTPARGRYITDSELRRIKISSLYDNSGQIKSSGLIFCYIIDMAYLTGQRLSDIVDLEWSQIKNDGIYFETQKTGARVLIEWTEKLKQLVKNIKEKTKKLNETYVFANLSGNKYDSKSITTKWWIIARRAKVTDAHFHDIRAKAITDKEEKEGLTSAQHMGGHTTQGMTVKYVRQTKHRKIKATR